MWSEGELSFACDRLLDRIDHAVEVEGASLDTESGRRVVVRARQELVASIKSHQRFFGVGIPADDKRSSQAELRDILNDAVLSGGGLERIVPSELDDPIDQFTLAALHEKIAVSGVFLDEGSRHGAVEIPLLPANQLFEDR